VRWQPAWELVSWSSELLLGRQVTETEEAMALEAVTR
jgi:hypothetical protein